MKEPTSFTLATNIVQHAALTQHTKDLVDGECLIAQCFADGFRVKKITGDQARLVSALLGGTPGNVSNSAYKTFERPNAPTRTFEGEAQDVGADMFLQLMSPAIQQVAQQVEAVAKANVVGDLYAGVLAGLLTALANEFSKPVALEFLQMAISQFDDVLIEVGPVQ